MPLALNEEQNRGLVDLFTCNPFTEPFEIGSGAGGVVYRYRYHGHNDPKMDAKIRPFLTQYKASDGTVFEYIGIKTSVNPDNIKQDLLFSIELSQPFVEASLENRPVEPGFNLSGAAVWSNFDPLSDTVNVVLTKLEIGDVEEIIEVDHNGKKTIVGLEFTSGGLDKIFRDGLANNYKSNAVTPRDKGFQSAMQDDLAITVGQIFGSLDESHYKLVMSKKPLYVIHGDLAIRNLLLSGVDSKALKGVPHDDRIPVHFQAHVNDFGHSIFTDNMYQEHDMIHPEFFPVRYSDWGRLVNRKITAASDLYAKRMAFFETLAVLERDPAKFNSIVSENGEYQTPSEAGMYVAYKAKSSEVAIQQYIRNCRDKKLVTSEEGLIYLTCFEPYLDIATTLGKRLEEVKLEEDRALLANCFNNYFEKLLAHKIKMLQANELNPQNAHAFLVSLHRLMQMNVSDTFKQNNPIYAEVLKITQAFPLTTYKQPDSVNNFTEVFLPAISTLQNLILPNRQETLLSDVSTYSKDYDENVMVARNLLSQAEELKAEDFHSLNDDLDYWLDRSNEKLSLQEKINQLNKEIQDLSELVQKQLAVNSSTQESVRRNPRSLRGLDAINTKLFEAHRNLQLLQTKITADEELWKSLVARRTEVFKIEQERILQEIEKQKEQYKLAINKLGLEPTKISVIDVGKTLGMLLSIEKLFYEYQRLGKYAPDISPDIQVLFDTPLLKNLNEIPSYKPLLDAFADERQRNLSKATKKERAKSAKQSTPENLRKDQPQTTAKAAATIKDDNASQTQTPTEMEPTVAEATGLNDTSSVNSTLDSAVPDAQTTSNSASIDNTLQNASPYTSMPDPKQKPIKSTNVSSDNLNEHPVVSAQITSPPASHYGAVTSQPQKSTQEQLVPDVYGSMPDPSTIVVEEQSATINIPTPNLDGYTSVPPPPSTPEPVTKLVNNAEDEPTNNNQETSIASNDDHYTQVEPKPYIPQQSVADAAAEYVSALNHLFKVNGISSTQELNLQLDIAQFAKDSKDPNLMSNAVTTLVDIFISMNGIKEAEDNYRKATQGKPIDIADVIAIAAMKGIDADPEKITSISQIPDSIRLIESTISDLITQIKKAKVNPDQSNRKPTTSANTESSDFRKTMEEIYAKEKLFQQQLNYLNNYFFDEKGQLRSNKELKLELTPQARFTLEHLLRPYQKMLAELPAVSKPNLETTEEQTNAAVAVISSRTTQQSFFDHVKTNASQTPTLLAITDKLPVNVRKTIQDAINAPIQKATSIPNDIVKINNHVQDSQEPAHKKLESLLAFAKSKSQKAVEGIRKAAAKATARSVDNAFHHHKEDIKAEQRGKIKNLETACRTHISEMITDKSMAKQVKTVLEMLAAYGIKQHTDEMGLLKVKKVQELLTGILQQKSPEELLKYIDMKLQQDTDVYEHKAHTGDTKLVIFLHDLQRALGEKDVPENKPKHISFSGKTNLLKTRQKKDADIRVLVRDLLVATQALEAQLQNLALPPEQRKPAPTASELGLFQTNNRRKTNEVALPEVTNTLPGNSN